MQTELVVVNAKIVAVLEILNSGEFKNYDIIREFLNLKYFIETPKRGIEDVQETLRYATRLMYHVQAEFNNTKHPRFVQAYALRLMASAVIEAWLDPYDDSDWGYAQRAEAVRSYAQEAHDLIVGLYVK